MIKDQSNSLPGQLQVCRGLKRSKMKNRTKLSTLLALTGAFLLFCSDNLFACHRSDVDFGGWLKGHSANIEMQSDNRTNNSIFAVSSQVSTEVTIHPTTSSIYATSDSSATSTDCHWRTTNIEKFFNDSYQQIAEESAQGTGLHLEALASLSGCSTEQYETFEKALYRNHSYVFADKDYDGSIDNFFNILNTDEDLLQCWGQS